MSVSESDIEFTFGEQYGNLVLKYDDTPYYTERFNAQPGAKAVDFIAVSDKHYVLIEVKNCIGDESGNRWRIAPNNQKRDTAGADGRDVSTRDSLDIEVAQKTAMTLAGMLGAFSNPMPATKHASCDAFARALCSQEITNGQRKIVVVLVLDGKFACASRDEHTIRRRLREELEKKIKWLSATVLVTTSDELEQTGLHITASRNSR